ncbi:hypothetical protein JTB14_033674 [Gonioctena quinquepunctata]|nr:hypothetical protein JTB14_033674 [Gonioctena quinquepunctata]
MANQESNNFFLLIHTMTITESDYVVEAQFFHAFSRDFANARLVAKRLRLRIHPRLRGNRNKARLQRLNAPNLRSLMKRNSSNVKHHLRALHVNQIQNIPPRVVEDGSNEIGVAIPQNSISKTRIEKEEKPQQPRISKNNVQLGQESSPEETSRWLMANRFEKYVDTFGQFSGDDMFRMSREDLIQICGDADGIRLHNAIHLKTIAPKLKLYVCRENSSVYNAIFLSSHSNAELIQKLSLMLGLPHDQVHDIYMEGPRLIHIQLNDDVLKHIKEETMFTLEVLPQENNGYILLLKKSIK